MAAIHELQNVVTTKHVADLKYVLLFYHKYQLREGLYSRLVST